MDFATVEIRRAWLMAAAPETVYLWIKRNSETELNRSNLARGVDPQLITLFNDLNDRNERLISLGIAQFGFSVELAKKLWASGDKAIRHAIVSNELVNLSTVFSENNGITEILSGADTELQRAYIQNQSIGPKMLAVIIDGYTNAEDDNRGIRFASYAIQNPILWKKKPSGVFEEDGWSNYTAELPFHSIYRLLINVQPTLEVARILCNEISKLGRWLVPPEEFKDALDPEPDNKRYWMVWYERRELLALKKMLEKWILAEAKTGLEYIEKNAYYYALRSEIASLVPSSKIKLREYLISHSDIAIRAGYHSKP